MCVFLQDPLLFPLLVNLLGPLQSLAPVHLHHGVETLLLLSQLHLDLLLLLDLSITDGLALSAQDQLRATKKVLMLWFIPLLVFFAK